MTNDFFSLCFFWGIPFEFPWTKKNNETWHFRCHWYLPLPLTGGEDSETRVEYHRGQCCHQCLWKVWSMATGTPGGGGVKIKEAEAGWYLVIYPFWLLNTSSFPSGSHWDCHGGSCFKALVLLEDLEVQRLRSTVVSVSSAISATAMLAEMGPRSKESYYCISDAVDGSPAPPRAVTYLNLVTNGG